MPRLGSRRLVLAVSAAKPVLGSRKGFWMTLVAWLPGLQCRRMARGVRQDMARGSLDTVSEGVRRARAQLTGEKEYHNVDERYHTQNRLVLTTRMNASDLEKYHKARSAAPRALMCAQISLMCCVADAEALSAHCTVLDEMATGWKAHHCRVGWLCGRRRWRRRC